MKKIVLVASLLVGITINAQDKVNQAALQKISEEAQIKNQEAQLHKEAYSEGVHSFPEEVSFEGFTSTGIPEYLSVDSQTQINSMNADYLYDGTIPGVEVTGSGLTAYIWDGGAIRTTHQEFGGRATNVENTGSGSHSTPVAGVIIASGMTPAAKGIAYEANLLGYNFTNNIDEISSASSDPANSNYMISNHSYGSL